MDTSNTIDTFSKMTISRKRQTWSGLYPATDKHGIFLSLLTEKHQNYLGLKTYQNRNNEQVFLYSWT